MPTPVLRICQQARAAAALTRELNTSAKDAVLVRLADAIDAGRDRLKAANAADVERGPRGRGLGHPRRPADPDRRPDHRAW